MCKSGMHKSGHVIFSGCSDVRQARRGFEPRSTDSESVVLTATPTSQSWTYIGAWYPIALF